VKETQKKRSKATIGLDDVLKCLDVCCLDVGQWKEWPPSDVHGIETLKLFK
jgi:hypothetical protein